MDELLDLLSAYISEGDIELSDNAFLYAVACRIFDDLEQLEQL